MSRFGNLADQYFDDAGDPLISGQIYFYETGTSTFKNTYSDINLSIANPNPVLLSAAGRQPNIFFDGVAKAILTNASDVQIEVRDPIGETTSTFGTPWLASKIYSAGQVVRGSDGVYYESLLNGNQGNDPTASGSGTYWSLLYSIAWSAGQTYQTGFMVTGSDEVLYQSLTNNNINHNPVSSPAYWANPATVAWQASITYGLDANVTGSDGIIYTSTGSGNINKNPISNPSNWIRINISWKATVTYPINSNVIGSNGVFYQSLVANNINFEPSANSTKWVAAVAAAAASAAAALVSANAAAASAATALAMTGTSTTSLAIGTGSKTLTTQSGKTFTVGRFIQIGVTNSGANFMNGQITSYSGTTLVVNVTSIGGSGTHNTWTLDLSGSKGATGNTGGGLAAVVDDTSPQLGGNLALGSFDIPVSPTQQTALNLKFPAPVLTGTSLTAVKGNYYIATAGGITITLPSSPSAGDYLAIKDGTGAAATTTFTVARNGSKIASSATDLVFDKNFADIVMTYVNSTIGWSV